MRIWQERVIGLLVSHLAAVFDGNTNVAWGASHIVNLSRKVSPNDFLCDRNLILRDTSCMTAPRQPVPT